MILHYALIFAMVCFALGAVMNLVAVARGPTLADRVLAVDTLTVNVIALLMLYGVLASPAARMFEPALLLAMTGFVATVAYARHVLRGSVME